MSNPFDLHGRIALVTGAARGLGEAIAAGLARAGATVVYNGRDEAALGIARGKLDRGLATDSAVFDVTQQQAVKAGIAAIEAKHGALDIVVNNAGIQHRGPLGDFSQQDWEAVIATNLTAPFLVAQAAARGMQQRGRGSIINIASLTLSLIHISEPTR